MSWSRYVVGWPKSTQINPYDNATMFARLLDAECYYMTAPLIADSESMRDMLLTSTSVRTVLEWVPKIDVALLSAIDLTADSKLLEYGILSAEQVLSLVDAGAVGDIAGHYLDVQGCRVSHPLNALRVAPALAVVRRIPKIVLAAGGLQKVSIIRARDPSGSLPCVDYRRTSGRSPRRHGAYFNGSNLNGKDLAHEQPSHRTQWHSLPAAISAGCGRLY